MVSAADDRIDPAAAGAIPVSRAATTFRVRRRRLSPARQRRLDRGRSTHGIDAHGPLLDLAAHDVVLDVGFGHGESTIALALAQPAIQVIGVEVHDPGVASLLDAIERSGASNVRVVHGDALVLLGRIGAGMLAGVRVYFPDPWPKTRQHHRRLVGGDTVAAFADRLRPGGFLHMATDDADYATAVERACVRDGRLVGGRVDRPDWRPVTRFETRAITAGRPVTDLWFVRSARVCSVDPTGVATLR